MAQDLYDDGNWEEAVSTWQIARDMGIGIKYCPMAVARMHKYAYEMTWQHV